MHTYPPLPTPIPIRWRWTKLHTTGIMPTWHTHARWKVRAQPAAALRWMMPPSRGSSQSQTRPGMGTSSQRTCALSATTTHSSDYLWCLKHWITAKCLKIIQVKWTTHLHLSWQACHALLQPYSLCAGNRNHEGATNTSYNEVTRNSPVYIAVHRKICIRTHAHTQTGKYQAQVKVVVAEMFFQNWTAGRL